mmetsp:Transcript_78885/g.174682  ORF Transcript_78885/g.174682 Transcript_78885/m.174682 type:complete len:371 (-) Transcript_78885:8-1120(-)
MCIGSALSTMRCCGTGAEAATCGAVVAAASVVGGRTRRRGAKQTRLPQPIAAQVRPTPRLLAAMTQLLCVAPERGLPPPFSAAEKFIWLVLLLAKLPLSTTAVSPLRWGETAFRPASVRLPLGGAPKPVARAMAGGIAEVARADLDDDFGNEGDLWLAFLKVFLCSPLAWAICAEASLASAAPGGGDNAGATRGEAAAPPLLQRRSLGLAATVASTRAGGGWAALGDAAHLALRRARPGPAAAVAQSAGVGSAGATARAIGCPLGEPRRFRGRPSPLEIPWKAVIPLAGSRAVTARTGKLLTLSASPSAAATLRTRPLSETEILGVSVRLGRTGSDAGSPSSGSRFRASRALAPFSEARRAIDPPRRKKA